MRNAPISPDRLELPRPLPRRPSLSHVVFDFDGTLSWLRHGWPEMMLEGWLKLLPQARGETDADRRALLMEIIIGYNGRPTIHQMERFAEIAAGRGGFTLDPEKLRYDYQCRLDREIERRTAKIQSHEVATDAFVVSGARAFLEKLRGAGMKLMILSSTYELRVLEEAGLLDVARYFGDRIIGSPADPRGFSKRAVLEEWLQTEDISGEHLLSIGDGPVEIAATKALGGTAIALCSDENENGSGIMDPTKRAQLLAAGADAAIPDFREAWTLFLMLRGDQT